MDTDYYCVECDEYYTKKELEESYPAHMHEDYICPECAEDLVYLGQE